jgi:16S rRNA (uracil1498-N3)-methyltransferase
MALPFFYISEFNNGQKTIGLDEQTSAHIVQVLRMKKGEPINLSDGKGKLLGCIIEEAQKKHCVVNVETINEQPVSKKNISIAISLLKNPGRFEWFLEKATEIGVTEIIPLICARTEKEKFRYNRMQSICISAMLQSQQCWLPVLHEPTEFSKLVTDSASAQKFIAYCEDGAYKKTLNSFPHYNQCTILIGPEGDFTEKEIQLALEHNFKPISLGDTRLRTETAGIVAATLLIMEKST